MRAMSLRLPVLVFVLLALLTVAAGLSAAEEAAPPPLATFVARAQIDGRFSDAHATAYDAARGRLYIAHGPYTPFDKTGNLSVIDTVAGRLIATRDLNIEPPIALSADGTRLYASSRLLDPVKKQKRLEVVDALALNVVGGFPFNCARGDVCNLAALAAGPAGRLYMVSGGQDNRIDVRSAAGDLLHRLTLDSPQPILVYLAVHGEKLYVAETSQSGGSEPHLHRYNISGNVPAPELSVTDAADLQGIEVSAQGTYLTSGSDLYSAATLQKVTGFPESRDASLARDEASLLAAVGDPGDLYNLRLVQFDRVTKAILRRAKISEYGSSSPPLENMIALQGGDLAVVFADAVRLYRAADHAVVLPLTFGNYCAGGPVRDDFSNPDSGWPIFDNGRTAVRYDNGQYSFLQRTDEVWSAVSRGDVWNNAQLAEVTLWRVDGHSLSGLVFGLNEDWTDFYTFEIVPATQNWYFYHFHDGNWQLIASGTAYWSLGANTLTIETDRFDGDSRMLVNSTVVRQLPAIPPGRIGLSAAGLIAPAETRFDNYFFLGPNCPRFGAASALDFSPPIERPLPEFIAQP